MTHDVFERVRQQNGIENEKFSRHPLRNAVRKVRAILC
jgi:hypothetical protein